MARTPRIPTLAATQYPAKGGRTVPERARREMYESFRQHADEARQTLVGIMRDEDVEAGHRIMAAKEILNRGFGTAPSVEIIEQTFKHQHSFDMDALRQLPPSELAALETALTRLIRIDRDAIDAEVVERDDD